MIRFCLTLKVVFGLALRQTVGFATSLLKFLGMNVPVPDFSTLLSKDGFHRALYTCAAEVVMKINNHTALSFPRSLQVFEVSPFDHYNIQYSV